MEVARVRSFMKRPGFGHSKPFRIDSPDRFAKRQHSIEQMQPELHNRRWIAVCAMVGVVQQHTEAEPPLQGKDGVDHFRWIPLVYHHDVGSAQFLFGKFTEARVVTVEAYIQLRKAAPELLH